MQTAGTLWGSLAVGNLPVHCTFRRGLIGKIRQNSGKNWPKSNEHLSNLAKIGEKIGKIVTLGGVLSVDNASGNISGIASSGEGSAATGLFGDAVSALANLGYGRADAHSAVLRVQTKSPSDNLSDVIAAALRQIGT